MKKILSNFYLLCFFFGLILWPGTTDSANAQNEAPVPGTHNPKPTKENLEIAQKAVDSLRTVEAVLDKEIDIKRYKDSVNKADTIKN